MGGEETDELAGIGGAEADGSPQCPSPGSAPMWSSL